VDRARARKLYGDGRLSAQRRVVAEAASAIGVAFTVEELHRAAAALSPAIGVATVYRATAALEAAGSLTRLGWRDGSALFALCDRDDHHHHLVCTDCGAVTGVDCPLDERANAAAAEAGYAISRHDITLFGVCAVCASGA
jgi:Fur family ferric uptake transcriptional regulator